MIKDLLITLFGAYQPIISNATISMQNPDLTAAYTVTAAICSIDWLWLGKFALFIIGFWAFMSLLLTLIKTVKG